MSVEVEVKIKIREKEELIQNLRNLGFRETKQVVERDIYYTSAHHDFAALDEALRVRTVEDLDSGHKTAVITYKGAKLDAVSMSRKELETEVGNAEICQEILKQIGFQPVLPVEKQRQYFQNDTMTACVDSVTGLGDYLELEILVEREEERPEALKQLEAMLEKLGYSMEETTRVSYLGMLMKKRR